MYSKIFSENTSKSSSTLLLLLSGRGSFRYFLCICKDWVAIYRIVVPWTVMTTAVFPCWTMVPCFLYYYAPWRCNKEWDDMTILKYIKAMSLLYKNSKAFILQTKRYRSPRQPNCFGLRRRQSIVFLGFRKSHTLNLPNGHIRKSPRCNWWREKKEAEDGKFETLQGTKQKNEWRNEEAVRWERKENRSPWERGS